MLPTPSFCRLVLVHALWLKFHCTILHRPYGRRFLASPNQAIPAMHGKRLFHFRARGPSSGVRGQVCLSFTLEAKNFPIPKFVGRESPCPLPLQALLYTRPTQPGRSEPLAAASASSAAALFPPPTLRRRCSSRRLCLVKQTPGSMRCRRLLPSAPPSG